MRNSWSIIYLTKDYEAFTAYFLERVGNCRRLEFGPERGGTGSVIELTMTKQVYKKMIILRLDRLESCRIFDNFNLETSLKKISLLVPGYKVHLQLLPLSFCGSFVLSSFAKHENFDLLGEANVSEGPFFCIFLCNGGALDLLRHVVDLSVSLTMSQPSVTT